MGLAKALIGNGKTILLIGLVLLTAMVVILGLRLKAVSEARTELGIQVQMLEVTLAAERANHERIVASLIEKAEKADARVKATAKVREDIARAPETDDGPVAPVVDRALNLLRERNATR